MTDKGGQELYDKTIGVMELLVSDVRLAIDHLEADMAFLKKNGPLECRTHTGVDHFTELSTLSSTIALLFDFYNLLGTIHAFEKHGQEINPMYLGMLKGQLRALAFMVDRYKVERDRWNKERSEVQARDNPEPSKGSLNHDNWLQELMDRLRRT